MTHAADTTVDIDELRRTPTVSVEQAGRALGVSRAYAYQMAREGTLPVIHLGPRRVRVPTVKLLEMLGLNDVSSRSDELAAAPADAAESQAQALRHRPPVGRRAAGFP